MPNERTILSIKMGDTMKENLIDLANKAKNEYVNDVTDCTEEEYISECILSNGWTRPPCNIEDKIYVVHQKQVFEATVYGVITQTYKNTNAIFLDASVKGDRYTFSKRFRYLDDAFLTKKEAEKRKRYW